MSHTLQTTNYDLPKFAGSDKPAWLTDFNGAMDSIDAQMKSNADTASEADLNSATALNKIGTLDNLTTDVKDNVVSAINEVDNHANVAQSTADEASAQAAIANNNVAKFNLGTASELVTTVNVGTITEAFTKVYCAKDTTGSIFKLYGRAEMRLNSAAYNKAIFTISDTGLRPTENYSIIAGATSSVYYSQANRDVVRPCTINIKTDGTATVEVELANELGNVQGATIWLTPCIYFNRQFGDAQ